MQAEGWLTGGIGGDLLCAMRIPALLAVLFILAAPVCKVSGADWYRWRGPDLNGISSETGWQEKWPAEGPKQLWKASVGTGFASFSVSRGRVYTMGNTKDSDITSCLDAQTGEVLWRHSYPAALDPNSFEGGPCATPAVADGRVFTFSRKGDLFCLDAAKGTVIWARHLNRELGLEIPRWGCASSALVTGNLVVQNMGSAGVALDARTGKVVWTSGKTSGAYATPVPVKIGADPCLAIFSRQSLIVVKTASGQEVFSFPWKTDYDVNAADPIIDGNKIFISSGYNRGAALLELDGTTPRKVWENKNMRNHFNTSVFWKGYIYGPDDSGLRCIAVDSGEVKWTDKEFRKGSLMIAGGKLVGLSERGELIIAEPTPDAFKPISRAKVLTGKCWTAPVLSNGHIYCRNAVGDVVCVDVSGK